jgi:hypothetical protein
MLASKKTLGERMRNTKWWRSFTWYVAGSIAGGVTMGLAFGVVGARLFAALDPTAAAVAALVLVAGLVGVAFEFHLFGLRLPTIVRQVDENWLGRYRPWLYAGGFGYQLGLGVVTVVTSAGVYLTWILCALTGTVWGGVVIGATFGLVRALPLLLVARVDGPASLRGRLRAFNARAPIASRAATASVVLVPVFALVALGLGG